MITMTDLTPRLFRAPLTAALAVLLSACAGGTTLPTPEQPAPGPDTDTDTDTEYRGVPGFDTRTHPGDDVMRRWRSASPYRWVGYYLPAPCHTGTSWVGKRQDLRDGGWGIAILYVGEQDWPDAAASDVGRADSVASEEPTGERCTRTNLSGRQGTADGADAAQAAAAEGFAEGSVVYLDVERVDAVSDSLAAYVGAWAAALEEAGYAPGLYAHARNADRLLEAMNAGLAPGSPQPRLWVASPGGFGIRRGPRESGFPATIWQGVLDTRESWDGASLLIDINVADDPDPSSPGG